MKSFLVIGAGQFGHHMCKELAQQKCEIMLIDKNSEAIEDLIKYVTSAKIADCTNREVLESFDIPGFDACFVCMGQSFQYSLEITDLLHELGAKKIFSKADEDIQAKFLLRAGANEIIFPEKDIAQRLAIKESSDSIFDCIPLTNDFNIFEISVDSKWVGRTISEIDFRNEYNLIILAIKRDEQLEILPPTNYLFKPDEHLMVMGRYEDIKKITDSQ